MSLLNKGLKYSLDIKKKVIDLDLGAETYITYMPIADQENFRW